MSKKEKKQTYQHVPGMQDVLHQDHIYWRHVLATTQHVMDLYGFERIDTPILEFVDVFKRGVGQGTDIVEKEMYVFEDRNGSILSLRPEFTAGLMRAYVENGLHIRPTPLKLWTYGPLFRHERSQKGRYRQHSQINLEILGEKDPLVDSELISLAWALFSKLGLTGLTLYLHSTGCLQCRPQYIQALVDYFKPHEDMLPDNDKHRLEKNPLRILDTKEKKTQALFVDAPHLTDYLCQDCQTHFTKLRSYLDTLRIPYTVDYKLVRGLDYYTKTVFEIKAHGSLGSQDTICGGGRYDGLVETLGGKSTPGIGFGSGIERIVLTMQSQHVDLPTIPYPTAYVAYLGESAKLVAIKLVNDLRNANIISLVGSGDRSLKSQMKSADKSHAHYAVIIGENELAQGVATVRNMTSKEQESVPLEKLAQKLESLIHLQFLPITETHAWAITKWIYPPPYDMYNTNLAKIEESVQDFLNPEYNYYVILEKSGKLVGYCCFGADSQVSDGDYSTDAIDIGIGIHPNLTGGGRGQNYVKAIVNFAQNTFKKKILRVTIAEFNQRALRVCQRIGFTPTQMFERKSDGKKFVVLTKRV
ncbi:MAG: histidine--tRNA ligase [Anaerolineaceae bacterium 4572_78]|nr:MAG: histidine--tRNA ligase [Anaerolineaceae bacterium 4572_78]